MKYLDYPELELLSRALTFESSECKVFTRLEAYSCKAVTKEKRLFKTLESAYLRSASMSPPEHLDATLASPFGRLDQPSARKTLFLLIATLNGAFPDHDFSEVNPDDFRKETSPAMVLNSLSTTLNSLRSNSNGPRSYSSLPSSYDQRISNHGDSKSGLNRIGANSFSGPNTYGLSPSSIGSHPALAAIMDDIMCVSECEVFTFHPDVDSDPHATADLDEEGAPDEDTFDDAYWSEDGDVNMSTIDDTEDGGGTPRQDLYDREDAPMFDEDFEGGFGGSSNRNFSSSEASSEPRTPRTPTSTSQGTSKSYFSSKHPTQSTSPSNSTLFSSFENQNQKSLLGMTEEYEYENEEELDGTGAGLLWATYAFFYNRKLKRILFVSVWSRKNSREVYSSSHHQSPIQGGFSNQTALSSRSESNRPSSNTIANRALGGSQTQISNPSPAKRAIARTNSSRSLNGGKGRGRTSSGSPAPSALSPFPHASPRVSRGPTPLNSPNSSKPVTSTGLGNAIQSFSAPNSTTAKQSQSQVDPTSTSTIDPSQSQQPNKRSIENLESNLSEHKKIRT